MISSGKKRALVAFLTGRFRERQKGSESYFKFLKSLAEINDANIYLDDNNLLSALASYFKEETLNQDDFISSVDSDVELLNSENIDVITSLEENYPFKLSSNLRSKAPNLLFLRGNKRLLTKPSVGFCGSRKASERGLEVCKDIVTQVSSASIVSVAGYAAGVDQMAHLTALDQGAGTIIVLPQGILDFSIRRSLRPVWDWERVLIVSEFLPHASWTVGRAMQRNKTIIGLSDALVVIEAGLKGGTLAAGKDALAIGHPLFAPIYESKISNKAEGNAVLINNGASPILKSKAAGQANLKKLLASIENRIYSPSRDDRLI